MLSITRLASQIYGAFTAEDVQALAREFACGTCVLSPQEESENIRTLLAASSWDRGDGFYSPYFLTETVLGEIKARAGRRSRQLPTREYGEAAARTEYGRCGEMLFEQLSQALGSPLLAELLFLTGTELLQSEQCGASYFKEKVETLTGRDWTEFSGLEEALCRYADELPLWTYYGESAKA